MDNSITEKINEHNHPVDSVQKIDRQVLQENYKRKATSSIFTRPN